jgi:uncharacterized membrane protein
MDIKSKTIAFLAGLFSQEVTIILAAALPVFELRLAIPLGIIKYDLPVVQVYILALIGNLVPVIPLLLILKYFFHELEYLPFIGKLFKWWFARVQRKSKIVERWGFWGLVFFVAIPLPITGAWTGTVAATLVQMRIKKAFLAIAIGVAIAGIIMTILSVFAGSAIESWLAFVSNNR